MDNLQLIFALVFFAGLSLFLFIQRRRLVVEWMIFPAVYMAMYRSSWGLKSMDSIARKARPFLRVMGTVAVIIGFLGMGLISFQLVKNLSDLAFKEGAKSTVGVVQPFAQNVPGTIFVPFIYFIVSIFVIAVLHEFSHGVMARVHGCKVKSSGFAFLGIFLPVIPAAFVEPSEQEMARRPAMAQLSILAAGAVSNILFALILLGIVFFAIQPLTSSLIDPLGVEVISVEKGSPAALSGLSPGELITGINGIQVNDSRGLLSILGSKKPGDALRIQTNVTDRAAVLAESKSSPGKAYMGFQVMNRFEISAGARSRMGTIPAEILLWLSGLLFWLFNLSLGIGLFNLVPLGPIDGGKMMKIALSNWLEEKTANKVWMIVSIALLSAIFLNVGAAFFM